MNETKQRLALLQTARQMNQLGLNQGASGNVSLRFQEGFLITPSGMPYDQCSPEDLIWMSLDGKPQGRRKPSSEWRVHRDIYQARPDAGAVLHAHSVNCTTLACLNKSIPAFHYMVAMAGGNDIRCTPYATFGSQALSDHVLEALKDRKACLLGHHGVVCLDVDLSRVLDLSVEVEHLAKVYVQCLTLGEPNIIDADEMQTVIRKFANYGSDAQA